MCLRQLLEGCTPFIANWDGALCLPQRVNPTTSTVPGHAWGDRQVRMRRLCISVIAESLELHSCQGLALESGAQAAGADAGAWSLQPGSHVYQEKNGSSNSVISLGYIYYGIALSILTK